MKTNESHHDYKNQYKLNYMDGFEKIRLEIGIHLLPFVSSEAKEETLREKVSLLRNAINENLGFLLPSIHVVDELSLKPYNKYQININESVVSNGIIKPNHYLAIKTPLATSDIPNAEPTKEPFFGEDVYWIEEVQKQFAEDNGYEIITPLSVLMSRLDYSIRKNLYKLIDRTYIHNLLEEVNANHPVLIKEINKYDISLYTIQNILTQLTKESVSIRYIPMILEGIIDAHVLGFSGEQHFNSVLMIVREKLKEVICHKSLIKDDVLHVLLLDKIIENASTFNRFDGCYFNSDEISIDDERKFIDSLINHIQKAKMSDINPAILTSSSDVRFALANIVLKYNIDCPVLSVNELSNNHKDIQTFGTIELN